MELITNYEEIRALRKIKEAKEDLLVRNNFGKTWVNIIEEK